MENLAIRQYENFRYGDVPPFDMENSADMFSGVRQIFEDMKMDEAHIGTEVWSPLSEIIKPGQTVVIKPNLVLNMKDIEEQLYTTTNPSLIRVIVEYVWKALEHKGKIIVGDAPSSETDFEQLINMTGYGEMISELQERGINVELVDFRAVKVISKDGIWVGEQKNKGKAEGVLVNLAKKSQFYGENAKYHGAGYDVHQTIKHHHGECQEYKVSKIVLSADVVISVPKLKTHRKAGVTCCLKNLVGINCDKNYLPHFTMGAKNMNGDEMPELAPMNKFKMGMYNLFREYVIAYTWKYIGNISVKILERKKKKTVDIHNEENKSTSNSATSLHARLSGQPISSGAWQGNETISKMILDLNRIFLYADGMGKVHDIPQRTVFYVVDGIYCGMGNGPVDATPLYAGVLACGRNGAAIDYELIKKLNIEPSCIPLYRRAKAEKNKWLWSGESGDNYFNGKLIDDKEIMNITLNEPDGWHYEKRMM